MSCDISNEEEATAMASKESQAVAELYRQWLAAPARHANWSVAEQERLVEDTWITLGAEPGGVDYVEVDTGGPRPALWAIPKGSPEDTVLFAVHGGGFITGSVYTHRKLYASLAKAVGVRALLPSYRLVHEGGVFPVPLDEVFGAYRWLLDQGVDAKRIVFAGDSVGGNLALATQLKAKEQGLPLPAASLLMSPVTDHSRSMESMTTNRGKDALFSLEFLLQMDSGYLGGTSAQHPYVSPLFGDLTGLGPIFSQVGDQELLLDDSRELGVRAEKAGVEARVDVFPEQQHTFHMMAGRAPEADDAINRFAQWLRPKLDSTAPTGSRTTT
jgi:acetyl esterase/lipase